MDLYTLDERDAWFHLYGTGQPCQERVQSNKIRNEKSFAHSGTRAHNLEIWSPVLCRLSYTGFDESGPI